MNVSMFGENSALCLMTEIIVSYLLIYTLSPGYVRIQDKCCVKNGSVMQTNLYSPFPHHL